jgi:hypothetical protein
VENVLSCWRVFTTLNKTDGHFCHRLGFKEQSEHLNIIKLVCNYGWNLF